MWAVKVVVVISPLPFFSSMKTWNLHPLRCPATAATVRTVSLPVWTLMVSASHHIEFLIIVLCV